MSVWSGLTVIICSHLSGKHGTVRTQYLQDMLNSLATGEMLPERVILSYTSKTHDIKLSDFELLGLNLNILKRGWRLSQLEHLLLTISEESLKVVLLVDDDDLVSPNLIKTYYEIYIQKGQPRYYWFQCGVVRAFNPTARNFNPEWKLEMKLDDSIEYDYGGTCCSVETLQYYLKVLLYDGYDLALSACDVALSRMGHIQSGDMRNYISENPCIIIMNPQKRIVKELVVQPLYFRRVWRKDPRLHLSVEEKLQEIKNKMALGRSPNSSPLLGRNPAKLI